MTNAQNVEDRVWAIVNSLPQRDLIASADAKMWIAEVVAAHGEMAVWHAIRLGGFGGSEIGVLVRNKMGVRADHQVSAHDIVEGKLMRRAPLESSAHMTRGHENEDFHARRFWKKYDAVRDQVAFDRLKNASGLRPWMRYSPDDVVCMPRMLAVDDAGALSVLETPGQMHRWLVDYKAPSVVETGDEISFQYACQLTQGAMLAQHADLELNGMMLSQFDWANWALKDDVVLWDDAIAQAVLDAGDYYWDMLMRGVVPAYVRKPAAEGLDEYTSRYMTAARTYANLAALASAASDRANEVRKHLLEPLSGRRFGDTKLEFGAGAPVLTARANKVVDAELVTKLFTDEELAQCSVGKLTYDAAAMEQYLRANNVDLKPFRRHALDQAKVFEVAAARGLDADALVTERLVLSPARPIKAEMENFIDQHYPLALALACDDGVAQAPTDGDVPEPPAPAGG